MSGGWVGGWEGVCVWVRARARVCGGGGRQVEVLKVRGVQIDGERVALGVGVIGPAIIELRHSLSWQR